jgi:hypothetical protein
MRAVVAVMLLSTSLLAADKKTSPVKVPETLISGQLSYSDGPILGAMVYLDAYVGDDCVAVASKSEKRSPEEDARMEACKKELGPVASSATGQYRFENLQPGAYKLWFRWILKKRPDVMMPVEFNGDYVLAYYESKEKPPVYTALAQRQIFTLQRGEAKAVDFHYSRK